MAECGKESQSPHGSKTLPPPGKRSGVREFAGEQTPAEEHTVVVADVGHHDCQQIHPAQQQVELLGSASSGWQAATKRGGTVCARPGIFAALWVLLLGVDNQSCANARESMFKSYL
jgi:hypothetical protein